MKIFKNLFILTFTCFILNSCGSKSELPIEKIEKNLKNLETYTILLEDMKEEGTFSTTYYHKYRVVTPEDAHVTPWFKVPENYYRLNSGFLGMALVNKKDGKLSSEVTPPGYQYVGDSRYGQWKTDSSGSSFWSFYGKYAMFKNLMGGWYRPVRRYDYDNYRDFSRRNMVYYGANNDYGTKGRVSRQNNPSFYQRRKSRETNFSKKFKNNLKSKVGRTRTSSFRGKAGRIGK